MERVKQFFADQKTDEAGEWAVKLEIDILVLYGLSIVALLFAIIYAGAGGFLLPWGIYTGFFAWVIIGFGFFAGYKQHLLCVQIYGILSILLTIILVGFVVWAWITCSAMWAVASLTGLGVVLVIMSLFSLAMAISQAFSCYFSYKLWQTLKGSQGAPPLSEAEVQY